MVLSSVMLISVLVTEMARGATIRLELAAHRRDEVKAEAVARMGVELYRLILMASKALGRNPMIMEFGQAFGVNGDSLWQVVPAINTSLLRMIFVSGGDLDDDEVDDVRARGVSDEVRAESREGSILDRNFLDFDGDFYAEVSDETRFVYVGRFSANSFGELLDLPAAQQLLGLMRKERFEDWFQDNGIDRYELIANLADWTDPDDNRLFQGGSETALYERLDEPYKPKNAPFDTREEIRLVEGWHLDGVWERVGRNLTIYGGGKVNINSAHKPVMHALLAAYLEGAYTPEYIDQLVEMIAQRRGTPMSVGGVNFTSAGHFKTYVEREFGVAFRREIVDAITTESSTYRVHSVGEVGDARVEIHAVFDYSRNPTGQIVAWSIR
jgi:type II secretory pathway component PulK